MTGVLLGLLLLTSKIKGDLWSIVEYTMNIMKEALKDIDEIRDGITPENRRSKLALLFKGMLHILVLFPSAYFRTIKLVCSIVSEVIKRMA